MPLAAGTSWADTVRMTAEEKARYQCDISFVGGLYGDNPYDKYSNKLSASTQQLIAELLEQNAFLWGEGDRLLPAVTPALLAECREKAPALCNYGFAMPDDYYFRQWTLARKLSNIERQLLLALVAQQYDFRLYTRADEHVPPEIPRFPQVDAMTGQLKVFSASRINLNITLRSIETGVPLRVFDIMSRAGFVLTDYRADGRELFEEDREIVMFKTPEEMVDKMDFYLNNETQRRKIGLNAYEKVKKCFSYEKQLQKIIKILYPGS
jgi:spore maturation protein CgeB